MNRIVKYILSLFIPDAKIDPNNKIVLYMEGNEIAMGISGELQNNSNEEWVMETGAMTFLETRGNNIWEKELSMKITSPEGALLFKSPCIVDSLDVTTGDEYEYYATLKGDIPNNFVFS